MTAFFKLNVYKTKVYIPKIGIDYLLCFGLCTRTEITTASKNDPSYAPWFYMHLYYCVQGLETSNLSLSWDSSTSIFFFILFLFLAF